MYIVCLAAERPQLPHVPLIFPRANFTEEGKTAAVGKRGADVSRSPCSACRAGGSACPLRFCSVQDHADCGDSLEFARSNVCVGCVYLGESVHGASVLFKGGKDGDQAAEAA